MAAAARQALASAAADTGGVLAAAAAERDAAVVEAQVCTPLASMWQSAAMFLCGNLLLNTWCRSFRDQSLAPHNGASASAGCNANATATKRMLPSRGGVGCTRRCRTACKSSLC